MPTQNSPIPVFDAHVDSIQRALDLGHDLGQEGPGHLDLARGKRGGLGAVVLTGWVDPSYIGKPDDGAPGRARALIDELHTLVRRLPDQVALAGNGEELASIQKSGRIAAIGGIEGGHAIDGSLERLQDFFERGVRVLTLVWNNHLDWIRSCQDRAGPEVPAGLSDFGNQVVRRMNRMGMLVDVSHACERAVRDVLLASDRPVIASHSACRDINDHPRNLSDACLRDLAEAGGVLGVVFCTPFLDREARAEEMGLRQRPGYRALKGKNDTETEALQSAYLQREASPFPIATVVQHVAHAVEVMGVEHVGLGSDFDGIQRTPAGLEGAHAYPALAQGLRDAGLSETDIHAIFWGNMARVFAQATGAGSTAHSCALSLQ